MHPLGSFEIFTCGRTSAGQESIAPWETPAKQTDVVFKKSDYFYWHLTLYLWQVFWPYTYKTWENPVGLITDETKTRTHCPFPKSLITTVFMSFGSFHFYAYDCTNTRPTTIWYGTRLFLRIFTSRFNLNAYVWEGQRLGKKMLSAGSLNRTPRSLISH